MGIGRQSYKYIYHRERARERERGEREGKGESRIHTCSFFSRLRLGMGKQISQKGSKVTEAPLHTEHCSVLLSCPMNTSEMNESSSCRYMCHALSACSLWLYKWERGPSNVINGYRRLDFDCEILMIANCEFFSRACNQKNRKVTLSVFYYTVRGRPSQSLDLQSGLTSWKM